MDAISQLKEKSVCINSEVIVTAVKAILYNKHLNINEIESISYTIESHNFFKDVLNLYVNEYTFICDTESYYIKVLRDNELCIYLLRDRSYPSEGIHINKHKNKHIDDFLLNLKNNLRDIRSFGSEDIIINSTEGTLKCVIKSNRDTGYLSGNFLLDCLLTTIEVYNKKLVITSKEEYTNYTNIYFKGDRSGDEVLVMDVEHEHAYFIPYTTRLTDPSDLVNCAIDVSCIRFNECLSVLDLYTSALRGDLNLKVRADNHRCSYVSLDFYNKSWELLLFSIKLRK